MPWSCRVTALTPPRMMFLAISTPRPRRPDTRTLEVWSRFMASWPNTYLPGWGGVCVPGQGLALQTLSSQCPCRCLVQPSSSPHLQLPGVKALIYVCFTAVLRHSLRTEEKNRFGEIHRGGRGQMHGDTEGSPTHHSHRPACQGPGRRHLRWLAPRALRTTRSGQGNS